MSRLGKQPILLPKQVTVTASNGKLSVKGPKGTLERELAAQVNVEVTEAQVLVSLREEFAECGNLHGLWRQLINNMVTGVHTGFEIKLQLIGVGYKAAVQGKNLELQLGFSHPTVLPIPAGIEIKIEKGTALSLLGSDKQVIGQFAANIRSLRKPEPYKGKGIRYENEYVRRKAGKSGKK